MSSREVTNLPRDRRLSEVMRGSIIQSHPDIIDVRAWLRSWNFRERIMLAIILMFALAITVILGGSKGEAQSLDIYQRPEEARDLH